MKYYFGIGASCFGPFLVHCDKVFSRLFGIRWLELLPTTDDYISYLFTLSGAVLILGRLFSIDMALSG